MRLPVRAVAALLLPVLLPACGPGVVPSPAPRPVPASGAPPVEAPPIPADAPHDEDRRPLPPPGPGDWRAAYDEGEQTVRAFRESCTNRRTEERSTVLLLPLGSTAGRTALLAFLRDGVAAFFHASTEIAPAAPLPAGAFVESRRQVDADAVLRPMENRLPGKALAFVALCEEDLFSGDMNFVFGVAAPRHRCAVLSLARLGEDGPLPARLLKVSWHEIGHLLGMDHCVRWHCLMNGSNSLAEADRAPLLPCRDCMEKLEYAVGGGTARLEATAAFLEKYEFAAEAAACRARAARSRR